MKLYIIHYAYFFHQLEKNSTQNNNNSQNTNELFQDTLRDKERIEKILARMTALKHAVAILMPYPKDEEQTTYHERALQTLQTFVSETIEHYPIYNFCENDEAEDNFYAVIEKVIYDYNNNLEHTFIHDNLTDKANRIIFLHHDFNFFKDRSLLGYKVIPIDPSSDSHLWKLEKELDLIQNYFDEEKAAEFNQLSAGLLAKEHEPEKAKKFEYLREEMDLRLNLAHTQLTVIKKYFGRHNQTKPGMLIPSDLTISHLQSDYEDDVKQIQQSFEVSNTAGAQVLATGQKLIEEFKHFKLANIADSQLTELAQSLTKQVKDYERIIQQCEENYTKIIEEYRYNFFAAKHPHNKQLKAQVLDQLNQPNYMSTDELSLACKIGNAFKIEELLSKLKTLEVKEKLEKLSENGLSPFHLLCKNGFVELVKQYLNLYKLNVKLPTEFGYHPLHLAVQSGSAKLVTILLEAGADINAMDKRYQNTPLHTALNCKNNEILNLLLHNGAKLLPDCEGLTVVHLAVKFQDDEALKIIVSQRPQEILITDQVTDKSALYQAVLMGNKEAAKLFFEAGKWLTMYEVKELLTIAQNTNNQRILVVLQVPIQVTQQYISFDASILTAQNNQSSSSHLFSANNNSNRL